MIDIFLSSTYPWFSLDLAYDSDPTLSSGVGAVSSKDSSEISSILISVSIYGDITFDSGYDVPDNELGFEILRPIELRVVLLLPAVKKVLRGETSEDYLHGLKLNSF